jgi:endoglucanase
MKLLTVAALTGGALAQSGAWGQCGGQGWSGATTCVAGYTCTFSNPWYSQCLPGSAPPPPASTTTTSSARPSTTSSATTLQTSTRVTTSSSGSSPTSAPGSFEWYGANESGGEFGEGTLPGQWGKHFIFPDPAAVSVSTSNLAS